MLCEYQGTVIVAVRLVTAVEMTGNEVVRVIGMGNGFMAAVVAVCVLRVMAAASVRNGAVCRIKGRYFQCVLVDVTVVHEMQVTVMQVIDVFRVLHARMGAVGRAVGVGMVGMCRVIHALI